MRNPEIKVVGVFAPTPAQGLNRLFEALSANFPVRFEHRNHGNYEGLDAVVLLGGNRATAETAIRAGLSCYAEILDDRVGIAATGREVRFAGNSEAPKPFAGRVVDLAERLVAKALKPNGEESVVASVAGRPVWSQWTNSKVRATFVSLKVPELALEELPFHHFSKDRFLNLLPLIDFIKHLTEDRSWIRPPPRACLMFDDPNLHWKTYGFIDFEKLGIHAETHNYHVAMATVPLDAWYINSRAAQIFKRHCKNLSLLVHGNDHIKRELARPTSNNERASLLSRALARIERLEIKAGLEVSRVMAPPHGACAEEMLKCMRTLGFEAACISYGSLRAHNAGKPWLENLGLAMAEVITGLPVMPRFRLARSCLNQIYLAAYLNQPIIPVGHHQEAAGKMELLAEIASVINSLGEVQWTDMKGISRSNYFVRRENNTLGIRMYSRRIVVTVPAGVNEVFLERTWASCDEVETLGLCDRLGRRLKFDFGERVPVNARAGERIDIALVGTETPRHAKRSTLTFSPWPLVRRQLAECRDRLIPFF